MGKLCWHYHYEQGDICKPQHTDDIDILYTVETPIKSSSWPYHNDIGDYRFIHPPTCTFTKKDKKNLQNDTFDSGDSEFGNDIQGFQDIQELFEEQICLHGDMDEYLYVPYSVPLDLCFVNKKKQPANKRKSRTKNSSFDVGMKNTTEQCLKPNGRDNDVNEKPPGSFPNKKNEYDDAAVEKEKKATAISSDIHVSKPTLHMIRKCHLTKEFLTSIAGANYIEGNTSSRAFAILSANSLFPSLLFEVCVADESADDSECTSMYVRCLEKWDSTWKSELDLIDLEKLIPQVIAEKHKSSVTSVTSSVTSPSTVRSKSVIHEHYQLKHYNYNIITRTDVWKKIAQQDYLDFSGEYLTEKVEKLCRICYTYTHVVCLRSCQHYFCEQCWRSYISTRVLNEGHGNFLCPEFQCSQRIDSITIWRFIEHGRISSIKKSDKLLELLSNQDQLLIRACPNQHCNRFAITSATQEVSKIFGVNSPVVVCECSMRWCIICQKSEHWPASCDAYDYFLNLRDKNQEILFDSTGKLYEVFADIKQCPWCKRLYQKNGVCDEMKCRCGVHFCWKCLKSRFYGYHVCTPVRAIRYTFLSTDDVTVNRTGQCQLKAIHYKHMATNVVSVKHKLQLHRCNFSRIRIHLHDDFKAFAMKTALDLLAEGYRLLSHLAVVQVVCHSKYLRYRLEVFSNKLKLFVTLLHESVTTERGTKKIKTKDLVQSTNNVLLCLDTLNEIIPITTSP